MTLVDPELFGSQTAFVQQSMAGLQAQTAAHDALFGLGRADWQADLQGGTITFMGAAHRAVAPVQVIGTYNTLDQSWLWGWDHPSVPPALGAHARLVRGFAEQHQLSALLSRTLSCSEQDIWAFAALAARLGAAQGAYRGPAGTALVMMTFGTLELTSA